MNRYVLTKDHRYGYEIFDMDRYDRNTAGYPCVFGSFMEKDASHAFVLASKIAVSDDKEELIGIIAMEQL